MPPPSLPSPARGNFLARHDSSASFTAPVGAAARAMRPVPAGGGRFDAMPAAGTLTLSSFPCRCTRARQPPPGPSPFSSLPFLSAGCGGNGSQAICCLQPAGARSGAGRPALVLAGRAMRQAAWPGGGGSQALLRRTVQCTLGLGQVEADRRTTLSPQQPHIIEALPSATLRLSQVSGQDPGREERGRWQEQGVGTRGAGLAVDSRCECG